MFVLLQLRGHKSTELQPPEKLISLYQYVLGFVADNNYTVIVQRIWDIHSLNPSDTEAETGASLRLSGLPVQPTHELQVEKTCLRNNWRKRLILSSVLHMCVQAHVYLHTETTIMVI